MHIFAHKSHIHNFGDDLNNELFNSVGKVEGKQILYSIGTILDGRVKPKSIVFGSGVRAKEFKKIKPEDCDVWFVRGPISGHLVKAPFISDPAYLIIDHPKYKKLSEQKKYGTSIIPYYKDKHLPIWGILRLFGFHIINRNTPTWQVIEEIKQSKRVISGAMHGAILADACRVPWQRLFISGSMGSEKDHVNHQKWNDWLLSILQPIPGIKIQTPFSYLKIKFLFAPIKWLEIIVKVVLNKQFFLSEDSVYDEIISKLRLEYQNLINLSKPNA